MERSVLVRRTAPLAVFLAVLAALIALAARNGGNDTTGPRKLVALPLSAGGSRATGGEGAPQAADSKAMYYGGEIVIPDSLLTGLPTEGPAYKLGGSPTTERIEALARALGVPGNVRTDDQGWVVGEGDVVLRVMKYGGLPWYLGPDKVATGRDIAVATAQPGTIEPATPEPAPPPPAPKPTTAPDGDAPVSSSSGGPADEPYCTSTSDGRTATTGCVLPAPCPVPPDGAEPALCPTPVAEPPKPSEAEARATAQKVFDALGLSGAAIEVLPSWGALEVVASPVVGGLPTSGFSTRVTVDASPKVQYANGFLGIPAFENDYPLLAPRDAVERGGAWGGPAIGRADIAPCTLDQPCPTPEPREVTKIRLGLLFMTSYDESQGAFLAPAWLLSFEVSDEYEEPVLALPDQYIATPPPATDLPATDAPTTDDPGTVDGGGADGSSGSDGGSATAAPPDAKVLYPSTAPE